jgi:predicted methyltransferase
VVDGGLCTACDVQVSYTAISRNRRCIASAAMRLFLRSGFGASLLVFAAACGGDKPPLFPEHEDIPANPTAVAAPEDPAGHVDSPSEAQPPSPPEKASVAAEGATPPPDEAPAAAQATAPVAEPRPSAESLEVPPAIDEIVNAMDRWDSDRDLDGGRHPGELLAFLGVVPGMRVGEIFAGRGYTTELLARGVGSKGRIWAENPANLPKMVAREFTERSQKSVMQNVVRVDQPLDSPFPPDARGLDAVVSVLAYHDTAWLGIDRGAMNKAVFDALKKGGQYVIVDHSAAAGHGTGDAKTLHRIEEATVTREVLAAGFESAGHADFLRNPQDPLDWNDSPSRAGEKRGTSDRFVLKFVRP